MARPRGTTSPRPQRVVTREEEETACERLQELKYLWESDLIPSKELYVERAAEILAESDPTSGHHNASETPQSESFFSRFSSASVAASVAAVVAAAAGASWWAWT